MLLGVFTSVPVWWKAIKKCDRKSAHRRIHRRTVETRFYNLSHAICYSYGAVNYLDASTHSTVVPHIWNENKKKTQKRIFLIDKNISNIWNNYILAPKAKRALVRDHEILKANHFSFGHLIKLPWALVVRSMKHAENRESRDLLSSFIHWNSNWCNLH